MTLHKNYRVAVQLGNGVSITVYVFMNEKNLEIKWLETWYKEVKLDFKVKHKILKGHCYSF